MNHNKTHLRASAPAYRRQAFAVKTERQQNTSREKTETYLSGRQGNCNKTYKSLSGDLGVTVTVCNHFPKNYRNTIKNYQQI